MIRQDFFASDLEQQAANFTNGCFLCLQQKPSHQRRSPLGMLSILLAKCKQWMMDFVDGLVKVGKYDSYFSAIDLFSGFRIAVPCSSTINAKETIELVERHIIQPFGVPSKLSSDRGPQLLQSKEFQDFLKFHNIDRHLDVAHAAYAHGMIEASYPHVSEVL